MQANHYVNDAGELRVSCEYNDDTIASFRSVGGLYDGSNREWVFPAASRRMAEGEVKRLFGLSEKTVTVQVASLIDASGGRTFSGWTDGKQVTLGGYVLATRRFRDGRAELKAPLAAGRIPATGGSTKKPKVNPAPDTVFIIEVREDFAEANGLRSEIVPGREDERGAPAPEEESEEGDFAKGTHLLRIEIPGGSREETAKRVRIIVEGWDDEELLKRLRPLITGGQ